MKDVLTVGEAAEKVGLDKNQTIRKEVLMHKNLVGVKEMSAILNVPVSWLYARTRSKSIPCYKKDKYVRFDPDEVIQWFRGRTAGQEA